MKIIKIVLLLALIVSLGMFYTIARQAVRKLASPIPSIPPIPTQVIPTSIPVNEFQFDGKAYQFHFHKILGDETLELIPNFENATFSAQIFKNNNCEFGINGGFYTKSGQPLGLFQIGDKKIGTQIQSATFNGFLSGTTSSSSSSLQIASSPSASLRIPRNDEEVDFVFQSGPLIFLTNIVQPNFIEEDYSRRSLIAKSITGDFYLFSIFEKDNEFSGPRLKDLRDIFLSPGFIAGIPASAGTSFELILNLDGGSASAFYDKQVQVEEFKPIGSFLCGKKNL